MRGNARAGADLISTDPQASSSPSRQRHSARLRLARRRARRAEQTRNLDRIAIVEAVGLERDGLSEDAAAEVLARVLGLYGVQIGTRSADGLLTATVTVRALRLHSSNLV